MVEYTDEVLDEMERMHDETGRSYFKARRIAEGISLSTTQVSMALRDLETEGEVDRWTSGSSDTTWMFA